MKIKGSLIAIFIMVNVSSKRASAVRANEEHLAEPESELIGFRIKNYAKKKHCCCLLHVDGDGNAK